MKYASTVALGVLIALFFIGSTSALVPDEVHWNVIHPGDLDIHGLPWMVANGADTATIQVLVINQSTGVNGLAVTFSVNNSVFGTVNPSTAITSNGMAQTIFRTGTKSGVARINATIFYRVNDSDLTEIYQTKTWFTELSIDHDTPYQLQSYTVPGEIQVGSAGNLSLFYTDKWGNPIDNRKNTEQVYFVVSSPDDTPVDGLAHFTGGSADNITVPVNAAGRANVQLIASTTPGTNVVLVHPVPTLFGDVPDRYFFISAISNATPFSIDQYFDPAGIQGQPPKQYADGVSLYQIVYTIRDRYGNGVANSGIHITTDLLGEDSTVYTNQYGQVMLTYGPKTTIGLIRIAATSLDNTSVSTYQYVRFISQEAVDMQFTAIPDSMPSRDVEGAYGAILRAKVIDENGNPVEGEPVTFSLGTPTYLGTYNVTMQPELTCTTALSDPDGYAEIEFLPGAFSATWADPLYEPSATGQVYATAHWENMTRSLNSTHSLKLTWKNYPYLSLETSVHPQTVNVTDTVDVHLMLRGDGWALQPNPIDVVLCTDRSGSMLEDNPDRMVNVIGASKIFNSQMSAIRDRVGLISFGTLGWANLSPTYKKLKGTYTTYRWGDRYLNDYYYDWTNVYGVSSGGSISSSSFIWVYQDNNYDIFSNDPTHQVYWPYTTTYQFSSNFQQYLDNHYPGNPHYYSNYANQDLNLSFDRSNVNTTINSMVPTGGTPMREALYRAVKMIISNTNRPKAVKAIVILSDGDYNWYGDPLARGTGSTNDPESYSTSNNYYKYADLNPTNQNMSRYAVNNGIKIYSIAFAADISATGKDTLRKLAETTGGKYYEADATDINEVYTAIAGDLKTEAGVNTQVNLNFGEIEVNYEMMTINDTYKVFDYVPDHATSTWERSYNQTHVFFDRVTDQSSQWNSPTDPYHLHFNVGTIRLGQVWEANYTLRVLTDGSINVFGPGSTIVFNNGESTLLLPATYITGVPGMVTTGVNTSELTITNVTSGSGDQGGTDYMVWNWDRHYTGVMQVTEIYQISNDGGQQWIQIGSRVLTPEEANLPGEFSYPKILLPLGQIDFRVVANAIDAPGPIIASPPPDPPGAIPTQTAYIKLK